MKRATAVYLTVNIVGILLFAWFVYRIEAQAHIEERHYRDAFDSFTFLATAVPAFVACAVVSCIWAVMALVDIAKRRDFERLRALIAVACVWAAVIFSMRFMPL